MPLVTFIIPVRHQDNAKDWGALTAKLRETMASIANQSRPEWRGIVVVNEGADLPPLPKGFSVAHVTFPPNDMHELQQGPKDAVLDAFRLDKGRRVLAGMLQAEASDYFMIVDDDDLVHTDITAHVADHPNANGWFIEQGYCWGDGGNWLFAIADFDKTCGTSLIIRSDLYGLPDRFEDAEVDWIKDRLGSHHRIRPILEDQGTPLVPLPFHGALYRVGHTGSHSQSAGLWRKYVLNGPILRRPRVLLSNLGRFRRIGSHMRKTYFG